MTSIGSFTLLVILSLTDETIPLTTNVLGRLSTIDHDGCTNRECGQI